MDLMTARNGLSGMPMSRSLPVVFVVDDDISVRESLEALILHEGWQPKVFDSAQEFLDYPPAMLPSCLVLDLNLPDFDGLDIQHKIARDRRCLPIIFLTGHGDVPKTVRAMKAGAVEFFTKPVDNDALLGAIRNAIDISHAALEREAEMNVLQERFASLSRREREVMALVSQGLLNKQVGGRLGISEITVKAHRGNVMEKMHAKSFAELVNMAGNLDLTTG